MLLSSQRCQRGSPKSRALLSFVASALRMQEDVSMSEPPAGTPAESPAESPAAKPASKHTFSAPRTARERVRAELTGEIKEVAFAQLASGGGAASSLRAIAREMGMASSALLRYFDNRDALLTALIIDSYTSLVEAV